MNTPHETEYDGYIEKKGWHRLFQHSPAEAGLYSFEMSGPRGDPEVRRLVDVGYGSGSLLSWGRGNGWQVAGVEVQEPLLAAGRAAGYSVHRDTSALESDSADLLTGMDVVEHMTSEQLREALTEWRRILRPNGWVVLRTPNCQSPAGLIDQFGDETHRQMLSGPILCEFLRRAGFEIVTVRGAKNTAEFTPGVHGRLRSMVKRALRLPARAIVRLALGTGDAVLEPSIVVVARNNK